MFLRKVVKPIQPISSYCCIYKSDISGLADLIQSPSFSEIIFGESANYISSILFYPFYFTSKITNSNFTGTLKVNKIPSTVNCFTNEKLEQPMLYAELTNLKGTKKSFLDVEPYSSYQLYLPFLGTIELNSGDILDKNVYIISNFDFQTGNLLYSIFSSPNDLKFPNSPFLDDADILVDSKVYFIGQYECQCGYLLPLGSNNAVENIRNVITGTINLAGQIIAGYAQAKTPTETTTTSTITHRTTNPKTNRLKTSSKTQNIAKTSTTKNYNPAPTVIASTTSILSNIQARAQFDKPYNALLKSLGSLDPVLITKKAIINDRSEEFYHFYGRPLGITKKLNELNGFTLISEINIEGEGFENITEEEREELHTILTSGVILDGKFTPPPIEPTYKSFTLINANYEKEYYTYYYIDGMTFEEYINTEEPKDLSITENNVLFKQYLISSNKGYMESTRVNKNDLISYGNYYFAGEVPITDQNLIIRDANRHFNDYNILLPRGFTFNDLINSEYNVNNIFGSSVIIEGSAEQPTYYNYYLYQEENSPSLNTLASGVYMYDSEELRVTEKTFYDNMQLDLVLLITIAPRKYNFEEYISSGFIHSEEFTYDDEGNVYYNGRLLTKGSYSSTNYLKKTDFVEGHFYIYEP